ncbi:type 1 glutamine amidotransferase [Salinirubellus salinus]|jgi:GMP synthase (glutamine-hydrolysing)|uniref:Type 1 glutamine amidotransferase n=1 Tax=Salinirubellus salinus TaxID=1364945 RepID=A0A9E7R2C4_9EURY|nr:type 1 glutamine amidotransferase [Salinirubellus salinus]UWM53964.1 type 1 glutamine amidotransferase [Salinirubellus salinus]
MDRPRLALLNASHEIHHTRRNFRRELPADLVEFTLTEEQYPDTFDVDGFVVTGSRSSVYWDEPWLPETKAWVREAIDRDLPALGICFGHQLLADVLGGTVEDMGEYELGYREVRKTAGTPVLSGVGESFSVFVTHSDAVTELPPGAELVAENDYGVHGFRAGHVFGVQAHPEYDKETAELVAQGKEGSVPDEQLAAVLSGITDEAYDAACESKTVFDEFVNYVEEVRAGRAPAGD